MLHGDDFLKKFARLIRVCLVCGDYLLEYSCSGVSGVWQAWLLTSAPL